MLIAVGGLVAMGCWLVIAAPRASAAGPPVIELESATAGYVQIHVSGTVEPNGEETRIYAEYATAEGGPFSYVKIGELPAGASGPTSVSGTIEEERLHPETEYFVRLDAETSEEHYSAVLRVTTKTVAKPIVSINAPSGLGTRAIHLSGQINPNAPEPEGSTSPDEQEAFRTSWHFKCTVVGGSSAENVCPGLEGSVTLGDALAADNASHVVTAEAEGLPPNKNLEVELIASNAGGAASAGPLTFRTQDFARALSVSETAATVYDEINPEGSSTTFHVDYGVTEGYGNSTPESSPIEAGGVVVEDHSPHPVQAALTGLQPGTTYHWRVVVTNAEGTSLGSDHTFTTFATPAAVGAGCANQAFRLGLGAALPDCRAYEQASPVGKNGGSVFGGIEMVQASASGNRVTFRAPSGLSTTGGTSSLPLYVASRGADGWSTTNTLPLGEPGQVFQLMGWDAELATAISAGGASGSASTAPGLYSADITSGTYSRTAALHSAQPESTYLPGVAANPSHFIIESRETLARGGIKGKPNLYEVNEGQINSVGLIPPPGKKTCAGDCVPAPGGSFAGPYRWTASDTEHGGGANYGALENFYTENTISRDGSKIFFTAAESGQLYLREDGTRTVQVSAPEEGVSDPNGTRPAAFVAATPDGSKVFFLSCEKLTAESTAESSSSTETCGEAEEGQDLYSFETSTRELTDLTEKANDPSAHETHGAAVKGLVGISEDGSFVYFVANGVLTGSDENANGEHAEPGTCSSNPAEVEKSCNLYLAHGKTVVFVARLSQGPSADGADWVPYDLNGVLKNSRVAADGTLLFGAKESLTGYDNSLVASGGANCHKEGAPSPACERELYRYQPTDGQLICVSCSPTNAAPTGPAVLESRQSGAPVLIHTIVQTRNVTGDGDRIFFDSPDSLVPADSNGVVDPYEWEAVGTGSCRAATANGGCLYLLSSGKSPHSSLLADVSANGNDAFFFTTQPLVPADGDENLDVYDARVGGGLQSQYPPAAPEPCVGEACLEAAVSPSIGGTAGTSSFVGPGNPKKSCPKGKVRKHGKCTKKPKKAPKRHKKKHGAGGAGKRSGAGNGNRGGSK